MHLVFRLPLFSLAPPPIPSPPVLTLPSTILLFFFSRQKEVTYDDLTGIDRDRTKKQTNFTS
uniref:Uncharacterized protein n=1 Tax=Anguilla anguilla TaxID=7936 RepID=A0A0E9V2I6_ANGAN